MECEKNSFKNQLFNSDGCNKKLCFTNADYYKDKTWLTYAEEADILNVILFKTTAKEWRQLNPELAQSSNLRDYASIPELTVLSNLESHNAELIKEGKDKEERFLLLSNIAEYQLQILNKNIKQIK